MRIYFTCIAFVVLVVCNDVNGFISSLGLRTSIQFKRQSTIQVAYTTITQLHSKKKQEQSNAPPSVNFNGEVIGANGRIGSFLAKTCGSYAPIPKGHTPGSKTREGEPILVSVPTAQIGNIINSTPKIRRNDLVFVTNGIPSDFLCNQSTQCVYDGIDIQEITVSVPHFGILKVGQDPISHESSPPTIIHGRHSQILKCVLLEYGVCVDVVEDIKNVDEASIKKLLWVSIMWLLCHDDIISGPLTVTEVHERRTSDVEDLVSELIPPANLILAKYHNDSQLDSTLSIGSVKEVIEYMEAYSYSMPNAIPNKLLAIDEFSQRNGCLLSIEGSPAQPLHTHFVQRVVGNIPKH